MDEDNVSGFLVKVVIEEVEDMHKAVKYSSLSSYMLKPPFLLTQGFDTNRTSQEKLFKHMCHFGAHAEWREGRGVFSSYLDVETAKNKCRLFNTTPL